MADLRMPEVNDCRFAGRLTCDPELKYTAGNTAFAKFALAVTKYIKKDGQRVEETFFLSCVAWGKTAEFANEYFHKGVAVLVDGELRMDKWTDSKTGQNREKPTFTVRNLQALEWADQKPGRQAEERPASPTPPRQEEVPGSEDDIPF
jgi:single-strand DNA-binding protein